ncbi:SDR family NAD(P)-dependent oxidoreductase [Bacillus paramycoides]|uniref:SDR family NAD(P)-dependent oxidoreductase n=1 Tax=Bacillus paramycoides TaxID=2026194 RepID=UPI0037FF4F64
MAKFDSLKGKVIVIAGGAKNLGGLLSKMYASEGAKVLIHYHSKQSQEEAEKSSPRYQKNGGEAILFQADLTDISNIQEVFQVAVKTYGRVDIAIRGTETILGMRGHSGKVFNNKNRRN